MRRKFYTVLRAGAKSLTLVPENTRMVPLQPSGTKPPFYIVDSYPYFIDLIKFLDDDRPVMSLIGHEEMLLAGNYSIAAEAAQHVHTILQHQPEGPYVVAGCSASGIVAYEIAQQMRARGREVSLVVLFDVPNPHYMSEYASLWTGVNSYRDDLRRLRIHEIPLWLALKLRWLLVKHTDWLQPPSLETNGAANQFEPWEERRAAARGYNPEPYSGKVLLFRRYQGELSIPYLEPVIGNQVRRCDRYLDPKFGWGEAVHDNLEVCQMNAFNHLELFKSEIECAAVARKLRERFNHDLDQYSAFPAGAEAESEPENRTA
jgi:thioesterase domain-containing protein